MDYHFSKNGVRYRGFTVSVKVPQERKPVIQERITIFKNA